MKKLRTTTVLLSLVCVGVIGLLLLKNGQDDKAAMAIQNQETISQDVEGQAEDEQGQASDDRDDEAKEENINDGPNPESEVGSNDQKEQISNEDVTNDTTQHIDINIEEIIALVGEDVYNFDSERVSRIENFSSLYVLVNKKNDLPPDYVPEELVVPDIAFSFDGDNPKKQMRPEAATALELLFKGSIDQGLNIYALSGYRSYDKQESIYNGNVKAMGEEATNKVSAKPGQSEHQTGLAMDVTCQSVGLDLVEAFGETEEGQWLAIHAHEYGFIIRYPQDKTEITQYNYEPWHVRYVGVTLATYLYEQEITLDQFYEQLNN